MSRPGPEFDTWDGMRARTWDAVGVHTIADLIGQLGGAGKSPSEQREILQDFRDSAAFLPAPGNIRDAVLQALEEPGG